MRAKWNLYAPKTNKTQEKRTLKQHKNARLQDVCVTARTLELERDSCFVAGAPKVGETPKTCLENTNLEKLEMLKTKYFENLRTDGAGKSRRFV